MVTGPPASSVLTPTGSQQGLSPLVERLLLDIVDDGFTVYCCGGKSFPTALAASYEWEHYLDIVTIKDFDRVTAARAPISGKFDMFALTEVVWAYQGPAQWALKALVSLVHPRHPDAPTTTYPAPPALHIPRHEQRPLTIRLPSSSRAGVRAARLAPQDRGRHLRAGLLRDTEHRIEEGALGSCCGAPWSTI